MKKIITTLALIGSLTAIAPAFAATDADVAEDQGAVAKDNGAIAKDNADIKKDQALKANAKANGNYGKQAVDSTAIGIDRTVKGEKTTEKAADKKILNHDATSDNGQ